MRRGIPWHIVIGTIGFFLLYVPLILVVVFSFNDSRSTAVWAGFSLKWYGEMWNDDGLRSGLMFSLLFAVISASLSIVLGTLLAFAMRRFGPFRLRRLLAGLASLPLVMPEIVTGLMMLLFFVSLRKLFPFWPPNGGVSVVIAHTTFGMAFASIVVQARLADLDNSVVEAAADLGAKPVDVFFSIIVPLIAPALIAGWLLAFTLSFEDAVITQFVNGPGTTTLPVEVFSRVRLSVKPDVNALATIMIAIVAFAVTLGMIFNARGRGKS